MDEKYFSSVLRCSSGGCRLWTHYDAMDNALIQLHGEKRVLLFPPSVAAGLYLDGSSSPIVGPEVDGEGIPYAWPKQFPAYKAARQAAIEVILQPGKCCLCQIQALFYLSAFLLIHTSPNTRR
jgi:hypothetical protein|tara:strand:- start:1804 stop:2172 length:369 start_codon:yes stop_codon:yes gene_type:complete